jgi:hypothetical protein
MNDRKVNFYKKNLLFNNYNIEKNLIKKEKKIFNSLSGS